MFWSSTHATTGGGRHRHHRDGGSRWCRSRPFSWTDVACQLPTTQHAHSGGCCARGGSAAVGNGQWARAGEAGSMPSARLPECLLRLLLRSASRHPWGGSLAADGEVTSELEGWFVLPCGYCGWDRPRMTWTAAVTICRVGGRAVARKPRPRVKKW